MGSGCWGTPQDIPKGRSCGRLCASSPPLLAGAWLEPGLASLAGVARRVASLFTQREPVGPKIMVNRDLGWRGGGQPVLAQLPTVSSVVGVAGLWGHFIEPAGLGGTWEKLHLPVSKKGPYLWGQHWRDALSGDLACGPVPEKTGSSLFLPARHCSEWYP